MHVFSRALLRSANGRRLLVEVQFGSGKCCLLWQHIPSPGGLAALATGACSRAEAADRSSDTSVTLSVKTRPRDSTGVFDQGASFWRCPERAAFVQQGRSVGLAPTRACSPISISIYSVRVCLRLGSGVGPFAPLRTAAFAFSEPELQLAEFRTGSRKFFECFFEWRTT